MQKSRSWRELLGVIVADPQERLRIAQESGISLVTLMRWVSGDANPLSEEVRLLLQTLPQHQQELFPAIAQEEIERIQQGGLLYDKRQIPAEVYEQVLQSNVTLSPELRFISLTRMIMQQLLRHLDPQRQGMAVTLAQCMPPSGEPARVRSLHGVIGLGTSPWEDDIHENYLLGCESLAGMAVLRGLTIIFNETMDLSEAYKDGVSIAQSSAACPIMRADRIAGCLQLSSTGKNFFGDEQLALAQSYVNLLALVFEPEEYYSSDILALRLLPPWRVQREYIDSFRQDAIETLQKSVNQQNVPPMMSANQVDILIWQRLEEELIKIAP